MELKRIAIGVLALIALPALLLTVVHTPPIPAVATPPSVEQVQR
jgi:hypothetical protein